MRKLKGPDYAAIDIYDACIEAIDDIETQDLYKEHRHHLIKINHAFDQATANASWATLPRCKRGKGHVVILGHLTKSDLVSLYTKYMVDTTGKSRNFYDNILASAGGFCPFCAGLGHVSTLDHYLPKSYFPAYSVHPLNLIPCCKDCNTGKNASFGQNVGDQSIHPYLDMDHFFEDRWIQARVDNSNNIILRFECSPPESWSQIDKDRAKSHFVSYNIAKRFSVQANAELSILANLRIGSLRALRPLEFRAYLLDFVSCPRLPLNGWLRTMYTALAETEWIHTFDFKELH